MSMRHFLDRRGDSKRHFFYMAEGCVHCGRKDGHLHEVDPTPYDVYVEDKPPPLLSVVSTWIDPWEEKIVVGEEIVP